MDITSQISQIRDSRIPPERIRKRAEYETKAIKLLTSRIHNLSFDSLESIISLIDSDFWQGEEVEGRFYPLFCKPNSNRIKTNNINELKEFLITIIEKEDVAKIDHLIPSLNGIGYGAASVFFYIKDSSKYNVFLPVTVKGLKVVYPEEAKELVYDSPFAENYPLFNDLCNNFKKKFSLKPQELDILLTVIAKQNQDEIPEKKEHGKVDKTELITVGSHEEAEAVLLEIGNLLGYETYTADPGKSFRKRKLCEIASSKDVPENLRSAKNVQAQEVIANTDKIVFATHYSRDIDRFNSFYKAAKKANRKLVITPKTAHLLTKLLDDKHLSVPNPLKDENILVYYKRKKSGTHDDKDYFLWERAFMNKMATYDYVQKHQKELVMDLDFYQFTELIDIKPEAGSHFIHSMSEPFSEEDIEDQVMHNWIDRFKMQFHQMHASGHMNKEQLAEMVNYISPKILFPIHRENQLLFKTYYSNVQPIEQAKEYYVK